MQTYQNTHSGFNPLQANSFKTPFCLSSDNVMGRPYHILYSFMVVWFRPGTFLLRLRNSDGPSEEGSLSAFMSKVIKLTSSTKQQQANENCLWSNSNWSLHISFFPSTGNVLNSDLVSMQCVKDAPFQEVKDFQCSVFWACQQEVAIAVEGQLANCTSMSCK